MVPLVRHGRRLTGILGAAGLALGAAACSSSASGGGEPGLGAPVVQFEPPVDGQVVARVEQGAPTIGDYVLRATVPVPPGTFPRPDGKSPFYVTSQDGASSPCQVEVVSRYPSAREDADVVEILAHVDRPAAAAPGDRIAYDVVYGPFDPPTFHADPDVANLLDTPGSLRLRTRDVFGNAYAVDLYADARGPVPGDSLRILRRGAVAAQVATHGALRPVQTVSGPSGTLTHMMGVHAYVTQWADEPFLSLDIRVHNAHSGLDTSDPLDDPLGKLYFEELELSLPAGWVVLYDLTCPSIGQSYAEGSRTIFPIVDELPNGKLHVMPKMAQFHRRLAVCRVGSEARALATLREETLAFVRAGQAPTLGELWSWWNPLTARYFPQRHRLPTLDHVGLASIRAARAADFAARRAQLAGTQAPTWPVLTTALGWAHPWGTAEGGMVSGNEIFLWEGVDVAAAASTEGYRLLELTHRMYTERQPNVLFNADGRHTRMPQWIRTSNGQQYVPIWWYNEPMLWASDPFGFGQAPTFQVDAVAAMGRQPAYEADLVQYQPIDEQHLVRYTRSPKVLVWLGNDALARDDIRSQAEGIRFTYHMYPQDLWYGIQPTGMLAARTNVDTHPSQGFSYGRAEGWGLDVMSAAYSILDETWRAETRPWFDLVVDLVEDGQSTCMGNVMSTPLYNVFNGQYRCRQSIEIAITDNALVGMRESVFGHADPTRAEQVDGILENSTYGMLDPVVWSNGHHGPWAMIATGPFDVAQPPFCSYWPSDGNYGVIDAYQTWSSFAYGYEVTGDSVFLTKAAEMLRDDLETRLHSDGLYYIQNRVALLALVQDMM